MTKFLRLSWVAGAVLAAGISQTAGAYTILDGYEGADSTKSGGGSYGDVVGADTQFDISSMEVNLTADTLKVQVNTNFAGKAGDAQYQNITEGNTGIGYGDLFLSTNGWDGVTGPAPYSTDNAANGEFWEYALSIDGDVFGTDGKIDGGARFASAGGTLSLYSLSGGDNTTTSLLSNDFMKTTTSTFNYRNGQEVAVNRASGNTSAVTDSDGAVIAGTWSVVNGAIKFEIDLSGTNLATSDLAFHWAMTCANDTIEGVPAPIILLLMATGLFGVGVSTAVRRKRA